MTATRRWMVAAALALAGCGSSEEADKTAPFVGAWTVSTGTLSAMCTGLPMPFQQKLDAAQQTITKTADGGISLTILQGCNIIMDVNGTVATLRVTNPPQSCMFPFMYMGVAVPVTGTFTAGNFTLNGDTASFSYMGNAAAQLLTCTVTGMGNSTKGAAPAPADAGSSAGG